MTTATLTYSGDTYQLDVALTTTSVVVEVAMARDAYQLALAEGFVGTRPEWLASLIGITSIHLPLADYLALPAAQQLDPAKIYTIPKII